MRVLTFLHSFEPGGVERDALRLNTAWRAAGIDVQVVLGRTEGRLADEAPDLPYTVLQRGRRSTAPIETLFMIWRLPAEIRRLRPDILFCAGNTYTIVAFAMRWLRGRQCPPIVLKVSNDLERRDLPWVARVGYHLWLRLQASSFARIVAMTPAALPEIAARMHREAVVIPNASLTMAAVNRFAAARDAVPLRPEAARHWLGVGRLARQKNFGLLVDAFARVATPADRLTIVGEGPQRAAIERQVQALGIARQVTLPGHLITLEPWFAQADAFVLSSDYEGLGVVVIEALAAGVPIAATDCCAAIAPLVAGAGALVPIRDAAALGEAMVAAAASTPDVAMMRSRARAFAVEATTPAWLRLFDRFATTRKLAKPPVRDAAVARQTQTER